MVTYGDVKTIFNSNTVVATMQKLPNLSSPVMDLVFTDRIQHPFAIVSKNLITPNVKELPVVLRGSPAIPLGGDKMELSFYEPCPVRFSRTLTAVDLNDLALLQQKGDSAVWVANYIDSMRKIARKTCEAICAIAISTGKINWPMQMNTGPHEVYIVDYGSPKEFQPVKKWDESKVGMADVYNTLKGIRQILRNEGFGGEIEVWAGTAAFEALLAIAQVHPEKSSLGVSVIEGGINVAGYIIKERGEIYTDPSTKQATPIMAVGNLLMVAKDAGHKLVYCAIDDVDAQLQPLPFFVKPVKIDDPSEIRLIAESKPFPIVNVNGVCTASVLQG